MPKINCPKEEQLKPEFSPLLLLLCLSNELRACERHLVVVVYFLFLSRTIPTLFSTPPKKECRSREWLNWFPMPSYQKAHIAVREVGGCEVVSAEEGTEIENIPGSSF